MKCFEFSDRLCDFLDRTLAVEDERAMEAHAAGCTRCAEELEDCRLALGVIAEAPAIEPPPQLIAEIIHETIGVPSGAVETAGGGRWGFLGALFHPFGQPRFVMGMAMTMLSFSMFTLYGQRAIDEWQAPQGSPTVALVERFSAKVAGLWDRAGEMTDSAITFYEMQTGEAAPGPAAEPVEGER
ncbi:MAG: zf-HC2 domain-containing protein [Bryobacterales bacterium]|nr:zf-HC2 domain-containing protein [Bryobacterales bacterium]